MAQKFNVDYDEEADVLSIYLDTARTKESLEVAEDLVIDLDKNDKIIGLEMFDAHKFLGTLNKSISKKMLSELREAGVEIVNYRNYKIITLILEHKDQIIKERLPAFSTVQYESPLLAST